MLAYREPTAAVLAPFGVAVGALPVLQNTLQHAQDEAVRAAGHTLVSAPPDGPHLRFTDRCWFTAAALRRLVETGGTGRLHIDDADWLATCGPLQPDGGTTELALHPGGRRPLAELPALPVDLGLRTHALPAGHPLLAHTRRPLRLGPAMVHGIHHWTHLSRVNQLALAAIAEQVGAELQAASPLRKLWAALRTLLRAGSLVPERIAASLTTRGKNCRIHSTAVVEMCALGDDVEIGAYAVLRGATVGSGARIEEHATVIGSTLGARAHVGRYAMITWSTLFPGASVSSGAGFQFSVFGPDCFVAMGASALDLSFGRPIQVEHEGRRVDSGHHLLGVAVGAQAVVGEGVRLNHGATVPAGLTLVRDASELYRGGGDPAAGPHVVRGGSAVPLRRSSAAGDRGDALDRGGHDALLGDDAGDE